MQMTFLEQDKLQKSWMMSMFSSCDSLYDSYDFFRARQAVQILDDVGV